MQGDYRVTDESSAAFRLGFRNFGMDGFGVVSPRLKQLVRKPRFSFPVINQEAEATDMVTWKGVRIFCWRLSGWPKAMHAIASRKVVRNAFMIFCLVVGLWVNN